MSTRPIEPVVLYNSNSGNSSLPATLPSARSPLGRMHLPHPRPTVSLDPRPVVIPILSSVIGFPILVFALICALRHRAIKLRRRDQQRKMQAGIRSVTLDLPPREKISFFSGGSSPELSMKETGDLGEPTQTTSMQATTLRSSLHLPGKSSNRCRVQFAGTDTARQMDASQSMKVDVVLQTIAAAAAASVIGADVTPPAWIEGRNQGGFFTR
ncbi:uncharacterized protein LOC129222993 [Uloborus diversus]|uniref:uncharacterized protein LOC129222993 n=1 Tax=Uloborus diversus TaxID=327109 RepID=UPI0024094B20|nr:uncharacterized protein LOC129222993 [Uloborus diversus]